MSGVATGTRLRGARDFVGLTVEEVSARIGISPERLLEIETGEAERAVDDLELRRLATAYEVSSAYFTDPMDDLTAGALVVIGRLDGELSESDKKEALCFAGFLRYAVDV
jgi:transcriptional regulator with XRE-family HTH domain